MKTTIQEQLGARELKPSEDSWKVLEARLDQHQKQDSGKKVIWLYVASIAAVFVILFNVFENTPAEPAVPEVQTVETTEEFKAPASDPLQENTTNESEMIAMPLEVEKSPVETNSAPERKQERIANRIEPKKEEVEPSSEVVPREVLLAEAPVAIQSEGIAEIAATQVKEEELDLLLQDAQVSMQMRKKREQRKADADWLLVEVEMELDQNFKDKVFEVIKNAVTNPKNTITKRDY